MIALFIFETVLGYILLQQTCTFVSLYGDVIIYFVQRGETGCFKADFSLKRKGVKSPKKKCDSQSVESVSWWDL